MVEDKKWILAKVVEAYLFPKSWVYLTSDMPSLQSKTRKVLYQELVYQMRLLKDCSLEKNWIHVKLSLGVIAHYK